MAAQIGAIAKLSQQNTTTDESAEHMLECSQPASMAKWLKDVKAGKLFAAVKFLQPGFALPMRLVLPLSVELSERKVGVTAKHLWDDELKDAPDVFAALLLSWSRRRR